MKMAFTRIKQEKNTVDVETARAKLDIALQAAAEKKIESPSSSDVDSNRGESSDVILKNEPVQTSTTLTLKKQTAKGQRKRRKKDDGSMRNSNSYVMKLFDRAVDLSPFTEDTPLYPICRAWINNQPNHLSTTSDEEPVKEELLPPDLPDDIEKASSEQGSKEVYQLPPPSSYAKDYPGDLRIPSPVATSNTDDDFVICSDVVGAPSKEVLLEQHMERWRAVRQKWKRCAQKNEDRYRKSGKMLKSLFERSQKQDDADSHEVWEAVKSVT